MAKSTIELTELWLGQIALSNTLLGLIEKQPGVALFTYDKDPIISLNEDIFEVIEFNT